MNIRRISKTIGLTSVVCLALFVAMAASSCRKEKADQTSPAPSPDFDLGHIMTCHKEQNRYPSQIISGLEGTWLWVSNTCFWSGDSTFTADRHVVVTFSDAGMYKVFEDSKVESEGTWKLSQAGDDVWSISTTKQSRYLHGYVWLCEDELVFFSSYIDGCDYYFTRK